MSGVDSVKAKGSSPGRNSVSMYSRTAFRIAAWLSGKSDMEIAFSKEVSL
jgi:hypothetical protein